MAGNALHIQADDAAALAAGDQCAVGRPLSKVKGGPAAPGVDSRKSTAAIREREWPVSSSLTVTRLELAAVIAGVLQCADHVQGDHQSALAVVDAGTVHAVALHPPGPAGKAAHGVDGIHVAQQQNRRQRLGSGPGGKARAAPSGRSFSVSMPSARQ